MKTNFTPTDLTPTVGGYNVRGYDLKFVGVKFVGVKSYKSVQTNLPLDSLISDSKLTKCHSDMSSI